MKKLLVLVAAIIFITALGTAGFAAKLNIGDKAPTIKVAKWIKGPAVDKLDTGKIYVIEFWATWCGPCKATIPHLTELSKKYKNKVTFAGISVWERGDVAAFVKNMGDKMGYSVATDDSAGFMAKNWMEAANQTGIPTAFIVDKGKIAWIGHPMRDLDKTLGLIIEGKFDVASYAKQRAEEIAAEEKKGELISDVEVLSEQGKHKEALAKLDDYIKEDPSFEEYAVPLKLQLMFACDEKAGYDYIQKLADGTMKDKPDMLLTMALSITGSKETLKTPDFKLASSLAGRALSISKEEDPSVLHGCSYVFESADDLAKAVDCETKAVALVEKDKNISPDVVNMLKKRIEDLKAKQK